MDSVGSNVPRLDVSGLGAGHDDVEQVAAPARYNELVAAGAGLAVWIGILVVNGPRLALQTTWLLLIALSLGTWTTMRRLRFSRSRLRLTLGPWSREVDLNQLESIRWKEGSGPLSQGTIYVRDRSGHQVAIEVARFKRGEEWGPLLLQAVGASGGTVDQPTRKILEHVGRAPHPEPQFTWKNLVGFPGFGFLAVLSIAALPVALLLIGHEQESAKPYQAAPVCSPQTESLCRQIREAVITERGEGKHSDGSTGAETWLRLQFSDRSAVYADLPASPEQVPFAPGQVVSAELWQGKVTMVTAAGKPQQTDNNPTWRAHDSVWALAVPLLFLFLSSLCMACVGLIMWRQRRLVRDHG